MGKSIKLGDKIIKPEDVSKIEKGKNFLYI